MQKSTARSIARRFMWGYQPPITCGHKWAEWRVESRPSVGNWRTEFTYRWRFCKACRQVEGILYETGPNERGW